MKDFADLLTGLVFTPSRNAKVRLLERYFDAAPDPDRGWALAAVSGALDLKAAKPAMIRGLVEERVDPTLFRLSYDYVGDLAETVALIWPAPRQQDETPTPLDLGAVVESLRGASRSETAPLLARLLDRLPADERFALIKLATGGLRVGVSARLARTALSNWAATKGVDASVERLEELWHGLEAPYAPLFSWLAGEGAAPEIDLASAFRPMMLAQPLDQGLYRADELRDNAETGDLTLSRLRERFAATDYAAEWKWDGVRVQAVVGASGARLYSRNGEDIAQAFPDLVETLTAPGCVDGELLIIVDGAVRPFSDLQKRLGRKTATRTLISGSPAWVRAYDLLHDGAEDLRTLTFRERRVRLERWLEAHAPPRVDLSPLIDFDAWETLALLRSGARAASQEGLMLKRWDSVYQSGRPLGPWWKWKRDPLSADCVLLYAQRGHGKRSSFFSDYTFGAWRDGPDGPELAPVGKAYSGYTDEELQRIDRWIRANTTDRYGPVRAVAPALVFEVAFDAVQRSTRHKSGVAMRFPRIKRVRWDKPAAEADRLETLERMIADA